MRPPRLALVSVLAFSLLTGCASSQSAPETSGKQHHAVGGDLQETTASLDETPTFLESVDPQIKEVYQIAAKHIDVLEYMPCYCGCGESAGHLNNQHCFINEVKEDGSVVWDDHGTRCGTCLEIAYVASGLKDQGKSLTEIRQIIDDHYKEGYAKPTPTPMPPA
ncbi:PCYCGC motif-containing (lipo)protein [Brevibacillus massiliensis]|uniref:PCYCGC motif-containing (lipo)protein n=1 Tax=Brevibacillus massiliensis TaxID=1118054 RepID=UPI00037FA1D9|nr:PCYCGC motif-containing (lipo)protein [Brevibacillus massiliensis]